jgi:hypothetical protein
MMKKGKGRHERVISVLVSFVVLTLLLLSGPADALELSINPFSDGDITQGAIINTTAELKINSNEKLMIEGPLILTIGDLIVCKMNLDGSNKDCMDGFDITLISRGDKDGKGYDQAESNALISIVCSYTKDKPITPLEWENYNTYLVRLDNGSLAAKGHKLMIQCNDFINNELGEADDPTTGKKKDKYLKGYEIFVAKYGDIF